MKKKFPFSAMILAGGRSSRMGEDKALLKFGGVTMVEHLAGVLSPLFEEMLVIVDRRDKTEGLALAGAKVYEDWIKGRGPLAALYTGLLYARQKAGCVFTCDMPLVDPEMVRGLAGFWEEGYDAVCLEESGRYQPFPGIYLRSSRHLMRFLLDKGENSMQKFLGVAAVKPLILEREKIRLLANLNTIEDYYRVLKEKKDDQVKSN